MVWLYSILGVVAVLVAMLVLSTVWEKRKTKREFRKLKIDDIQPLIQECIRTFKEKLGLELDLNDLDSCTVTLEDKVNTDALREAFAKKGLNWYFALPVGAFVGELILRHRKAGWQEEEDGSLSIWIQD